MLKVSEWRLTNMTVTTKLKVEQKELQDKIAALKEEMQSKSKELMKEVFREFFEKYADIVENVYWTQYVPFFNDGEPCVFRVNDIFILLKDDENACEYEGSTLFNRTDVQRLETKLSDLIEWEKDPIVVAKRYQAEYLQNFKKDPFVPRKIYDHNSGKYVEKSTEDLMKEWKPYHTSKENLMSELEQAKKFVDMYPNLEVDFNDLSNIVSSIDDDLMLDMFGDHVKVIVSASGIETEEYDHD
jgi:hypothetical protein